MNVADLLHDPRLREWAPRVATWIGAVLVASVAARWTWVFVTPPAMPFPAPTIQPGGAPVTVARFDPRPILEAHLFGVARGAAGGAPLSSLNLVLTATIVVPGGGYAMISVDGQPQMPFMVGWEVTQGASLRAVHPDRVILERGGMMETLILQGIDRNAAMALPAPATPTTSVRSTGPNAWTIAREEAQAILRDRDAMRALQFTANPGGGILLTDVPAGSFHERLGLRTGDVVRSVNGKPLNAIEDAVRLYRKYQSAPNVSIELVRGGSVEQFQYRFE